MQIYIARPDQNHGPYTLAEANAYLASGHFTLRDLAWFEGCADWMPLRQIPGIQAPGGGTQPPPATKSVAPPPPPSTPSGPPPSPFSQDSAAQPAPPPTEQKNRVTSIWLNRLFPPELWTAYRGATPEELLRLYGWRIAALVVLLFLLVKFAYALAMLGLLVALCGVVVGLQNPESFRPLFGERTSKSTVCWSFGALVMLFSVMASSLQPKTAVVEPLSAPEPIVSRPASRPSAEASVDSVSGANPNTKGNSAPESSKKRAAAPIPVAKRSAKDTIETAMREQFGKRLREVEVEELRKNTYSVTVRFNNSVRLTKEATKDYMDGDMQDAYRAIFTSGFKVVEAEIEAFGSGTDKFGKHFTAPAYETSLDGEVAAKINWDNHRAAKWDEIWTVIFLHHSYLAETRDPNAPEVNWLGTHPLKATISRQYGILVVTNLDSFSYRQVQVILNDSGVFGGFYYEIAQMQPGEQVEIHLSEFATKGESRRYNSDEYKLERVKVQCKTDYGLGVGQFTFKQ